MLWSRFADQRYTDGIAADETLYDALWGGLELAWQRTVQAVPLDRPALSGRRRPRPCLPRRGARRSFLEGRGSSVWRASGSGSSVLTRRLRRPGLGLRVEHRR